MFVIATYQVFHTGCKRTKQKWPFYKSVFRELLQYRAWQMNDAGEWLPLSVISVEGGPDTGHLRGQLSRQVKEVSLGVMSQDRGAVCEKRNPVMGQGRLLTLVSREADNHSWPRREGVCAPTCVRPCLEMKTVGTKPVVLTGHVGKGYHIWLTCPCWPGGGSWNGTSLLDNPRVLVQRLSKCVWSHLTNPANFLQIWLPYWGEIPIVSFGCHVSLCYIYWKEIQKR